jgi:putative ABC transport system permease protein
MFLVVIISSFMITVPQNISNTVSSRNFYTTMGIGLSDFSVYVTNAQTDDVQGLTAEITEKLSGDESVAKYATLTTRLFEMPKEDGAAERIQVTLGDHDMFPISYSKGAGPKTEREIAISNLYADDFGKTVGDTLVLTVDGNAVSLTVCGIYSDITNTGKTAKAQFAANEGDILNCSVWVAMRDAAQTGTAVARYKSEFSAARVIGIDDIAAQMFGDVAATIQTVSYVSIAVAALLVALLTLLFFQMLVVKDKHPVAILKSTGFTTRDIKTQYMIRSAVIFVLGVIIGTVLANTLGGFVGLALISSLGASSFHLEVNALFAYLLAPLLLAFCVFIATFLGTSGVRRVKIFEHIKEV